MQIFLFSRRILLSALQVTQIPLKGNISTVIKDFFMKAQEILPSLGKKKKKKKEYEVCVITSKYSLNL